MVSVRIDVGSGEAREALVAELHEAGTAGIVEGDGWVEAFFDDAEVARRFGEPVESEDVDWDARFRESFKPLLVGQRFFVVAPWRTEPTPEGRFRLVINPGAQCGTGHHPCTQLCLEAMEFLLRPGDSVLDVGTGSGILSQAAKFLGAGRVVACDIDPNTASVAQVPFFVGSAEAVKSGSFDVVIANISEEVVGSLKSELERVAPMRILSGFTNESGDWTCVVTRDRDE